RELRWVITRVLYPGIVVGAAKNAVVQERCWIGRSHERDLQRDALPRRRRSQYVDDEDTAGTLSLRWNSLVFDDVRSRRNHYGAPDDVARAGNCPRRPAPPRGPPGRGGRSGRGRTARENIA